MKMAIVGYGEEGKSAYRFFKDDYEITICDKNENVSVPDGVKSKLGEDYIEGIEEFDKVIVTAGAPLDQFPEEANLSSVTKEFFERCEVPIIGVTGTKGKGTTSSLIARILETAGHKVHLGGNIGVPALELLGEIKSEDIVVLELSSFQLDDLEMSPHISVVLPVKSDHLDYHKTRKNYAEAKANIAKHQSKDDLIVYHGKDKTAGEIANYSKAKKQPYLDKNFAHISDNSIFYGEDFIIDKDEIGLIGPHNMENVCAAITACWNITQDKESIKHALRSFYGLEHRLEFVAEIDEVDYYNDSFSTAETATLAAINSFENPMILILGGYEKGEKFKNLAKTIAESENIKRVLLIGENQEVIKNSLEKKGFKDYKLLHTQDIKDIVETARRESEAGDVVVLSPGSASFDMFDNYKDRGVKFKEAVLELS